MEGHVKCSVGQVFCLQLVEFVPTDCIVFDVDLYSSPRQRYDKDQRMSCYDTNETLAHRVCHERTS